MDQFRQLFAVWNWLPAFHAVAVSEHLPTASRRLHLTPSALSRTIRMLEAALGRKLFNRIGRTIKLNADGRRLLGGAVGAMGALAAGLDSLAAPDIVGSLFVSASGPLAQALVIPSLRGLQEDNRSIVPHVDAYDPREVTTLLLTGQLDVSFSSSPVRVRELECVSLGEASCSVYCGRSHPLFASEAALKQVLAHAFVVTCSSRSEVPDDGFPTGLERRIDIFVCQTALAIQLCLGEPLLTVLPDLAAQTMVQEGRLRRFTAPAIPPAHLYATHAATDRARRRAAPLVDTARAALARAVGSPAGRPPSTARRQRHRRAGPDT